MKKEGGAWIRYGNIVLKREGEWVFLERDDGAKGKILFVVLKMLHEDAGKRCSCGKGQIELNFRDISKPCLYCPACRQTYYPNPNGYGEAVAKLLGFRSMAKLFLTISRHTDN